MYLYMCLSYFLTIIIPIFQFWSIFSTILLIFSLCILIAQSIHIVRDSGRHFFAPGNSTNKSSSGDKPVSAYEALIYTDIFVCLVLLLEYLLRFICCPRKYDFIKCPKMIVSVLSLIPSVTAGVMFGLYSGTDLVVYNRTYMDVIGILFRMRILRVFALLRYDQYYPTLRVLIMTVSASWRAIATISMLLLAMTVFYGGCLYYLEIRRISSIPYGMWWAAVTMTTLGYGDVYPTTPAGYLLGVLCVVSGIIILVLPIPVVSMHYDHFTASMAQFEQLKAGFRHGDKPLLYTNMPVETLSNGKEVINMTK